VTTTRPDPTTLSSEPRTSVLRAARGHLPPGAQRVIRGGALRYGVATAPLRMLPDFLVVGAQRCGTTTLYRLLAEHPAIVKPLFHKGIGYFDLSYDRSWNWYRGHFPIASLAERRTRDTGAPMTFDSSGYYLYHPLGATRIARSMPDVKVVALVRDPVDRAHSAHKHEQARGFEDLPFEAAVELEAARIAGEADRMRADPSYQSFEHRHHSYLARGRYAEQIVAFQQALTPEQVFVIDANRFFAEPVEQFARLQEWLGLPAYRPPHVAQENARPRAPMPDSLRRRLLEYFEGPDAELTAILGTEPSWRA